MFNGAKIFNKNVNTKLIDDNNIAWNVCNVTSMDSMFRNTLHFNQEISLWNTFNLKNINNMFRDAKGMTFNIDKLQINTKKIDDKLNAKLIKYYIAWDTSNIIKMNNTFRNSNFNGNINNWNTDNVDSMYKMFCNNKKFNQDINTNNNGSYIAWRTNNVEDMTSMFENSILNENR